MRICIVGAGTYGCYIAKLLAEQHPQASVTILEVGTAHTKSEEELGLRSAVNGQPYSGLSKGRFFGLGGTSARWGGQLMTFGPNDFREPSPLMRDIVELNDKHSATVMRRLGVRKPPKERQLPCGLIIKSGIWLGYSKRNLYKLLRVGRLPNVTIRTGCRVTKLSFASNTITGIDVLDAGRTKQERYDHYFLAAGAFESNRLLAVSGITSRTFAFSDHLSQRAFRIRGTTKIGDTDFRFRFSGPCLLTQRLIGEVGTSSFFAHPIFNSDFSFFQRLKNTLYRRQVTASNIWGLLYRMPHAVAFFFNMLILRRLYVHGNAWYLQLDLENSPASGSCEVAPERDTHNQCGVCVRLTVDSRTDSLFSAARDAVRAYLNEHAVQYEELLPTTESSKYEDTYHPYGMFGSDSPSLQALFERFTNMLVINTGVLPRAGGINCTAALLPIIEEYVACHFHPTRS